MYSSNGQLGKAKAARASTLPTTGNSNTGAVVSPVSRVTNGKGCNRRQMSPTRMSQSTTRSSSSDVSGWTSMDEAHRKQNGRPVTWVGGGGLDIKWLSTLGVPGLRAVFLDVFGHYTASNNGAWLRRKLAEPAEGGRGRAAQIRARDASAAIWTTGRVRGVSKAAAARVTKLFAEELPSENRPHATRASKPVSRDYQLFGAPSQQPGLERQVMKKSDLRNKHAMRGLVVELLWQEDGHWWPATITQVDCSSVSVLYENGDIEQLATHDIIRDGLLSLGWVNPPGSPPADSDNCLSPGAASAAGSATADARYLARSQEPDEELESLLSYEHNCRNAIPDLKGDLDVLEPPCKRPKLESPSLDLLYSPSFRLSPPTADSNLSTPSALLPPPSAGPTTPMDATTCDWADNLLATAHRPTPPAREEAKPTSVSSPKPRVESKPSPVTFRLSNAGSSALLSPLNRIGASVNNLSRFGCDSPSRVPTRTPARGPANPFASPVVGAQGTLKHQPLPQGSCAQTEDLGMAALPLKVRTIPMQPLRPQTALTSSSLGLQSPSFRTRAGPGTAPVLPGQGIFRQPCRQGFASHLSNDVLSNTVSLVTAQSALPHLADSRQQTITTGMSHGSGSSRPPHTISQNLFPKPVTTAATADQGSVPNRGSLSQVAPQRNGMMGLAATSFGASTLSPRSVHDMAKSIFALPTGNMAASQEQQMPSSASSFMDSVATFTEGFALTHSEPEAMSDWAMGGKADLHASVFAQDAFEIIQLESAVHSDLSADISDQSWKIPAEMLITDTDDFVL